MTSDSITEQAARVREAICNAYGPHDLAGYQDESRCRAIADAAIAALAHQAPATERSCPTCGCDERYPTAVHIVDCPIESAEVGPVGDRFFERIDGRGYIERVHSHHSGTARVLAADDRYREVTIQAPATEDARSAVHRALAADWMTVANALGGDQAQYEAMLDGIVAAVRGAAPATEDEAAEVEWARAFRTNDGLFVDDNEGAFCDAEDVAAFVKPQNPESPYDLIVSRTVGPWREVSR